MKRMSGAARLGLGLGAVIMLLCLLLLLPPPAGANPDVAGEVWFGSSEYFTDDTSVIYINDTDKAGAGTIANIRVNSTADPAGIYITVSEEGTANGTFRGTFTFVYNSSSSDASNILNVTDRNNVTVQYADAAPSGTIVNYTTFNYTINATIFMNGTIFGTGDAINVTVYDNDTNTNSNATETMNVVVTSPSGGNITISLVENGNNTGQFEGNFTFNTTGNASSDSGDVLGTEEGDVIVIYLTDSLNSYGNSVTRINSSMMARSAAILFDNVSYYPADTAVVTVYDNDTRANANSSLLENVTINISTTSDPRGINLTLTETGNDTGIFNGTFGFVNNQSSNQTTGKINGTDPDLNGDAITAAYTDIKNGTGGSNSRVTNGTPKYYYTMDGDLDMDLSFYGPNSTVNITLNDSDRNTDPTVTENVDVLVNTTNNATGINVRLWETGLDTGMFQGNFTFSISGNTSDGDDIINASNNDEVNVIYNDNTNSSGDFAAITANATFYRGLNGTIDTNGTYLNGTYVALPANATILVNLTDTDTFANANGSGYDTVNVTISNADRGCQINVTLNETGVNTGIFNGTFRLNGTTCSNALGIMMFTAGGEDWLDINYTDGRNGTGNANSTANTRVLADDMAPAFSRVSSNDSDLVYSVGDMVNITVELDQPGANLTANFSGLDSGYVTNAENVTDWGNGSYTINYSISSGNSRNQGRYSINITAYDGAGNGPTHYNYTVTFSKLSMNESMIDFSTVSPNGSHGAIFDIENQDSVTQYNMTEHIEVYRDANLTYKTDLNETRTLYFMVPQNATRITFSLGANHSGTVLNSGIYDNSGVLQSSALSGTIYPSVSPDSAEVWYMRVTTANVTPTVSIAPNMRVYMNASGWFSSNLTSGADNFSANANTTIYMNLTAPLTNLLPSVYNGTLIYNNSNTSVSVPITFNISGPNAWYESNSSSPVKTLPNGSITLNVNLMRGFRTLNIDVNNTGNMNLTGLSMNLSSGTSAQTNFTRASGSNINISAVTGGAGSVTSSRHNMSFPDVAAGSSARIRLHFNTSEQTTEGVYTAYLSIYSTNGQPFNESNLTIRINLTRYLNVTVLNVTYNKSPAEPRPGDNITINLSVKYQNQDAVAGLVLGNFSAYDTWTAGSGPVRNRTSANLSVHDFSQNGSGIYMFNYTVPVRTALGKAEYGLHGIILEAWTSDSNIGNGSSSYNMSAPNVNMSINSFSTSMNNQTTGVFDIRIGNNGTATIYNVSVNTTKNGTCVTFNTSSCPVIGNMTAGGSRVACSILVTAGSSVCTENVTFRAWGVDARGTEYNVTQVSSIIDVNISSSGSSGDGTAGGGTASACSTDSDCSDLYFCNSTGYCESVACTSGFVSDHKCMKYAYGVRIVSYEPSVYVLLGSSNTTYVNVNNTGNTSTIKAELALSSTGLSSSTTPGEKVLGSMANYTFSVSVSASNESWIGNHSGTLKAYRSSDSGISDSVSVTVVVLPHEGRIVEINLSYEEYVPIVRALADEFESIKAGGFISPENLTAAERLVNTTKAVIMEIEAAIREGDYARAEALLRDLETYTNDERVMLDALRLEQQAGMGGAQGGLILWVAIGLVVVIIAGFLVYMFLPGEEGAAGYKAAKGAPKPGIINKLGNAIGGISGRFRKRPETVTRRMKEYAKGYERHRAFTYEQGENIGSKVKKLFKKNGE